MLSDTHWKQITVSKNEVYCLQVEKWRMFWIIFED